MPNKKEFALYKGSSPGLRPPGAGGVEEAAPSSRDSLYRLRDGNSGKLQYCQVISIFLCPKLNLLFLRRYLHFLPSCRFIYFLRGFALRMERTAERGTRFTELFSLQLIAHTINADLTECPFKSYSELSFDDSSLSHFSRGVRF